MEAAREIKEYGKENTLLDKITSDPIFSVTKSELESMINPEKYVGRAIGQTEEFIKDHVKPIIKNEYIYKKAKNKINV